MFTHDGDSEKIRAATLAGVSAYVVDGMSGERIGPIIDAAVARFEQFHALKRELDDIEEKLADRKVIEKAKGILMKSRNLSEEEAYRALRKQAMESNARLAEVVPPIDRGCRPHFVKPPLKLMHHASMVHRNSAKITAAGTSALLDTLIM